MCGAAALACASCEGQGILDSGRRLAAVGGVLGGALRGVSPGPEARLPRWATVGVQIGGVHRRGEQFGRRHEARVLLRLWNANFSATEI